MRKYGEGERKAVHSGEPGGPWKTSDALLCCRVSIQLPQTTPLWYWKAAEESDFLKKLEFEIFRSILLIFNLNTGNQLLYFEKSTGQVCFGETRYICEAAKGQLVATVVKGGMRGAWGLRD